jgi:copper(I)-binding protein
VFGFRSIPIFLLCLCASASTFAHSIKQKGFEIVHPWCFETSDPSIKTAAVYMVIRNETRKHDRLLGATSSIANKVELLQPFSTAVDAKSHILAALKVSIFSPR